MKKLLLLLILLACGVIDSFAQVAAYAMIGAEVKSPSSVFITLKTFGKKKKNIAFEAQCAALRITMFDGIEGTIYSRPLLNQGAAALHENEVYFQDLFNNRLMDIVKSTKMDSEFKKAVKGEKATLFTVEVNYIQLKKDLEKNKIKKQLGI